MRMKTIAPRSSSDRGRSAERIPIGSAISIQRIAPPRTSAAVTGAASTTISLTVAAVRVRAAERVVDDEPLEEERVLLVHRPVEPELVRHARDVLGVADLPAASRAGFGREQEEEDVRDERHPDEEDDGPEKSPDQVVEHRVRFRVVVAGEWAADPSPPSPVRRSARYFSADHVQERPRP